MEHNRHTELAQREARPYGLSVAGNDDKEHAP